MGNKRIQDLPAKGATIAANDILELSEYQSPGVYISKKILGSELGGDTTFMALTDTPASYTGQTLKFVRVNAGETGLEFATVASGLTYFTEAQNTIAPNNSTWVHQLSAVGTQANISIAVTPKGVGAITRQVPDGTATGGNRRGDNAVDFQATRATATQVAYGTSSITVGYANAANDHSAAFGYAGNAYAPNSFVANIQCTAGQHSAAFNYSSNATGSGSFATGYETLASGIFSSSFGEQSISSGYASMCVGVKGDTNGVFGRFTHAAFTPNTGAKFQRSNFVLQNRTTDASITRLKAGDFTSAASINNQVVLQNNNVFRYIGTIVGKVQSTSDVCVFDIDGIITRNATAGTTTLSISNITTVADTIGITGITITADTTLGCLAIEVQGKLATTIAWVANIETTEVLY